MARFRPPLAPRSGHILTNSDRKHRVGRVQRQLYRCMVALGRPVKMKDLLPWAYPHAGGKYKSWMRTHIHKAIRKFGVLVAPSRQRFTSSWRLKTVTPKSIAEHH
jgi:hypothetical protein